MYVGPMGGSWCFSRWSMWRGGGEGNLGGYMEADGTKARAEAREITAQVL